MRLTKSLTVLIICLLLFSSFLIIEKSIAQEVPSNNIEAYFDIEMVSATELKINCEVTVNKIRVESSGKTYTSTQIESNYISGNEYLLGVIGNQLQSLINETFQESFEGAKITSLNEYPVYENGQFHDDFSINLTSSYFGIAEEINAYSFLNGILDMGAQIEYRFNFKAKLGWNNTYAINFGDNYDFQKQTNGTWDGHTIIRWEVKNLNNLIDSKSGVLVLKDKNPTTHETGEDVFLDFKLNSTSQVTSFQVNILANAINIQNYNALPNFVSNLNYIPADGIRLFVDCRLISWDDVYQNTMQPIEQKIKSNIETPVFNQTLDLVFSWDKNSTTESIDSYNLQNMNEEPSVKAIFEDSDINLKIFNISARGLFGLTNAGAKSTAEKTDINFGENLNNIGYPYSVSLIMPTGVTLANKNTYTWNDTTQFQGTFESKTSPKYSKEEIDTVIEIDVENTDLDLVSFFTGQTELIFGLDLKETKKYNVTTISNEFSLPEKISLKYLNSDALRLCIEENIFTDDEVNTFLENEKISFENKLKSVLKGLEVSGHTDKDTFYNSLEWDGDINKMDHEKPVLTSYNAYSNYPVNFDLSITSTNFKIHEQKYYFSGIANQSVTYRMFFPSGLYINVDDAYKKSEVKETPDGRQYFEVNFSPNESNLTVEVSCDIQPSLLFILGALLPCFITLFITIILIAVIIIFRKKKKRGKAVIIEEDTSYKGEDYYVPPGSK